MFPGEHRSYSERYKPARQPGQLAEFFPWQREALERLREQTTHTSGRLRWESLSEHEFARLRFVRWCIANGRHYSHVGIEGEA